MTFRRGDAHHTIAAISFRAGTIECSCGAQLTEAPGQWRNSSNQFINAPAGSPEALAKAMQDHRASVNAPQAHGTKRVDPSVWRHAMSR